METVKGQTISCNSKQRSWNKHSICINPIYSKWKKCKNVFFISEEKSLVWLLEVISRGWDVFLPFLIFFSFAESLQRHQRSADKSEFSTTVACWAYSEWRILPPHWSLWNPDLCLSLFVPVEHSSGDIYDVRSSIKTPLSEIHWGH